MRFNALNAVKIVVSGAVGIGTTKIVGSIIKNHVTPANLFDKVTTASASWVIGGIIAEQTKKYTDKTIDDAYETGKKIVDKFKQTAALGRINRSESTFEDEGLDQNDFYRDKDDKWVPKEVIEETSENNHKTRVS